MISDLALNSATSRRSKVCNSPSPVISTESLASSTAGNALQRVGNLLVILVLHAERNDRGVFEENPAFGDRAHVELDARRAEAHQVRRLA